MLKPIAIILGISFVGEVLHKILPLPFPSSIYGLIVFFALLQLKIIKLDTVKPFSNFMLDIMPVFFVAPAIGLMETWNIMSEILIPVILIGVVTTGIIMVVTGIVSQKIIRKSKKGGINHG